MKDFKTSPIFYMGNKKKLIQKGLIGLFPDNISTFADIFGGSGVVSMNVDADNYIINDFDKNVVGLYNLFREYDYLTIVNHIESTISKYDLPTFGTNKSKFKDETRIAEFNRNYTKLREKYNQERNVLDFYTLMFFSFSQQFRFNKKNEFNMPRGNNNFTENNKKYIQHGLDFFKSEVAISNKDFLLIDYSIFTENDFLYFDPPYLGTLATYNENDGWNEKYEEDFYDVIIELNGRNVPFGISNVFHNKGIENTKLINFVKDNDLNVYGFEKFTYFACGKGVADTKEVFITNYEKRTEDTMDI